MEQNKFGVVTITQTGRFYEVKVGGKLLEYNGKQIPNVSQYITDVPGFIVANWHKDFFIINTKNGSIEIETKPTSPKKSLNFFLQIISEGKNYILDANLEATCSPIC